MNAASSINPAFSESNSIETQQNERLPFRHEEFRYIDPVDGEIKSAGCELLLGVKDPRAFLTEHGIEGKHKALEDGIEAARNLSDMPMVSVNIDGDWANDLDRVMGFEPFRNLPENLIFEITEVERLTPEAALALSAVALRQRAVFIDDMPTDESLENMRILFEVMGITNLDFGIKVDFKTTHALLGRPFNGNPEELYQKALEDLALMRDTMDASGAQPSWIVFEGLNYADELETVMRDFAPMLDSREPEERAQVLGQFFRDEVKTRETAPRS